MSNLLVVVDTNVFINAIFGNGAFPDFDSVLDLEEQGILRFAFSEFTRNELYRIVSRVVEEQDIFECYGFYEGLHEILSRSIFAPNVKRVDKVSSDKSDQPFVDLATTVDAKYFVTFDFQNGLLALGEYGGVKIVTPAQFMRLYKRNKLIS